MSAPTQYAHHRISIVEETKNHACECVSTNVVIRMLIASIHAHYGLPFRLSLYLFGKNVPTQCRQYTHFSGFFTSIFFVCTLSTKQQFTAIVWTTRVPKATVSFFEVQTNRLIEFVQQKFTWCRSLQSFTFCSILIWSTSLIQRSFAYIQNNETSDTYSKCMATTNINIF